MLERVGARLTNERFEFLKDRNAIVQRNQLRELPPDQRFARSSDESTVRVVHECESRIRLEATDEVALAVDSLGVAALARAQLLFGTSALGILPEQRDNQRRLQGNHRRNRE